mmetsp:Transcript_20295/g.49759  ORF Transcript_20295/g.49759 Transcript_20295/m.49759 type:complete len:95 (+) Transcript_20295:96-380(+)
MRFSLSQSLLLLAAPLFVTGAPFQRNSLSTSSLSQRTDLFGVSKLSHIARGGAQEGEEVEEEPLYLPGLLDAELTSSSEVNCHQFCQYSKRRRF